MSALRVVSLSIIAATLAAAASVALAASESEPVSRAEVKRQVLQARNDRELARRLRRCLTGRRAAVPARSGACEIFHSL